MSELVGTARWILAELTRRVNIILAAPTTGKAARTTACGHLNRLTPAAMALEGEVRLSAPFRTMENRLLVGEIRVVLMGTIPYLPAEHREPLLADLERLVGSDSVPLSVEPAEEFEVILERSRVGSAHSLADLLSALAAEPGLRAGLVSRGVGIAKAVANLAAEYRKHLKGDIVTAAEVSIARQCGTLRRLFARLQRPAQEHILAKIKQRLGRN